MEDNTEIREMRGVSRSRDQSVDESVLIWYEHVETVAKKRGKDVG